MISKEWDAELHAYLGGILRGLEGVALCINGTEDHVHGLVSLKPKHSISDVVREVKQNSTKWVKSKFGIYIFGWQEGFGVFSVSASQKEAVRGYIENQKEHHRIKTFQEEYRELLIKHGVSFEEKYLWD